MPPKGAIIVAVLILLWLAHDAEAAGPNPHDIVGQSRVKKSLEICADVEELTCKFGEPIDQLEGG
jgi:hypothetical protein